MVPASSSGLIEFRPTGSGRRAERSMRNLIAGKTHPFRRLSPRFQKLVSDAGYSGIRGDQFGIRILGEVLLRHRALPGVKAEDFAARLKQALENHLDTPGKNRVRVVLYGNQIVVFANRPNLPLVDQYHAAEAAHHRKVVARLKRDQMADRAADEGADLLVAEVDRVPNAGPPEMHSGGFLPHNRR
ncbi:hypothetical protein ACFL5U_01850 [Candidatus Margulisiibacteriota bacterium]